MTRLCVAIVLTFVLCTTTVPVLADGGDPGEKPVSSGAGDDTKPVPDASAVEQGQAGSDDEIMKKFTRHRPGGCPEGPPCNFED